MTSSIVEHLVQDRWKLLSKDSWVQRPDESEKNYNDRTAAQDRVFVNHKSTFGIPFVIRFDDNDYRVLWSKEINLEKLKRDVKSPFAVPFMCPLCQPWEYERVGQNYDPTVDRVFLCKVVRPVRQVVFTIKDRLGQEETHTYMYEGFIEDNGVNRKCLCLGKKPTR